MVAPLAIAVPADVLTPDGAKHKLMCLMSVCHVKLV